MLLFDVIRFRYLEKYREFSFGDDQPPPHANAQDVQEILDIQEAAQFDTKTEVLEELEQILVNDLTGPTSSYDPRFYDDFGIKLT